MEQPMRLQPIRSSCIQHMRANSPPTMPIGNAKLGPTPDLIEGTIASTSMPFMPTRRSISVKSTGND